MDGAGPSPEWSIIAEAGGIRAWVQSELRRKDLIDDRDTSTLSDKERKRYKARREEERRVRRTLMDQAWSAYKRANLVHLGIGVFYHDTADYDRYDIADPDARRRENDVPELADITALAKALEVPVPRLRWLAFHRDVDTGTHYHRWTVPKSDGGSRLISAPKPELKRIQRWIARSITEHLPVHGAAHGFLPGRSTVTNAAVHAGARAIVKFDLRNFYPTVTMPRVKGMFRKAGYIEQVATVLALLSTEAPREELMLRGRRHYVAVGPRSLPQGAPTSPSITNAICLSLDCRLAGLARALGARYTRYADDLTFSWPDGSDTASGTTSDTTSGKLPIGKLKDAVDRIVRDEGFLLHDKKTRIMRAGRRQKVTGLVVNRLAESQNQGDTDQGNSDDGDAAAASTATGCLARVPRKLRRQLRAAIHNRECGKAGKGESLDTLRGLAAYIHMCDPVQGKELLERIAKLDSRAPDDSPDAEAPTDTDGASGGNDDSEGTETR